MNSGNTTKMIFRFKIPKKTETPETAPGTERDAKKARPEVMVDVAPAESSKQDYLNQFRTALTEFSELKTWTATPIPPLPWQVKPLQEYIQTREENLHAVFALSTGMGKTYLFTTICALSNDSALILVPQINLIRQTIDSFAKFAPDIKIAKAKLKSITRQKEKVLTTTYQSMQKHYKNIDFSRFDSVFLDEAHKALSHERVKMVKAMKKAGSKICAVTATPWIETKRDEDR